MPLIQNRLNAEGSPYLRQHADNPVHWLPWGQEAFEQAKQQNKPIFLSIGYSTCHWCHVMNRESFSSPEVAEELNKTFICIKVDREERPDVDALYVDACQLMTGSAGWPLNIILTPDRKPFYAGTYFPPHSLPGRIGLVELTTSVAKLWNEDRDEAEKSASRIHESLLRLERRQTGFPLGDQALFKAVDELKQAFDQKNGGFSEAPKFPTPHNLLFLMRFAKRNLDTGCMDMVIRTLDAMRRGGIRDHIGGGFHRYSTDEAWLLPHFEKMLYDQALLMLAYTEAHQLTGRLRYQRTVRQIGEYCIRNMRHLDGAFYSAEDADSEGEEGQFYLWTFEELQKVLGKDLDLFKKVYPVSEEGNFLDESTMSRNGRNLIFRTEPLEETARRLGQDYTILRSKLEAMRHILYAARTSRIRPFRDKKILTDWNGLMIAALATAARTIHPCWKATAARTADFILEKMENNGRLYHLWHDGEAGVDGMLHDYACMAWGLTELYATTFDTNYLDKAIQLAQTMIDQMHDDLNGGFFATPESLELILVRQKDFRDAALPSGNAFALLALKKLAVLTGSKEFERCAQGIEQAFSTEVVQRPSAFTGLLMGVDFSLNGGTQVVVTGDRHRPDTSMLIQAAQSEFAPNMTLVHIPPDNVPPVLAHWAEGRPLVDEKATAYVCRNFACQEPVTDPGDLLEQLETPSPASGRNDKQET
ncbi:MAG: thioredoxin domain-containing protein [Desulfovibrio sp.]|uniref:thioredoxin domain-containing protein n=1 Tax=Desulfovibrio sp. 7SRBS1 TaxID=3378064 RepID=UPI003B3E9EFD